MSTIIIRSVQPLISFVAECYIGPVPHAGCNGGVFAAVDAGSSASAKVARTHFSVVRRGPDWAVLDADIATGRPHQIRIMTGYAYV